MPLKQMVVNGFDHGTKMTSTQILTNPNIKVVFIRIIGATPTGIRQTANEITFSNAFNWIISNKNKYNIILLIMLNLYYIIPSSLVLGATYLFVNKKNNQISITLPRRKLNVSSKDKFLLI